MIESPILVEEVISDTEFKQLGQMLLRWSHTENTIGNCLKRLLRLSLDEAHIVVVPLSLEQRMTKIRDLCKLRRLKPKAAKALGELELCVRAMQSVRNQIAHGIVDYDNDHGFKIYNKKNKITRTKKEIFSSIELVNYTAHVALAFRYALGFTGLQVGIAHYGLPDRPPIPEFLQSCFPKPQTQKKAKPKRPPRSSRAKR